MNVTTLPAVDQIRGLDYQSHELPELARVTVQYTGPRNAWFALTMSLPDAQYLLNALEQLSSESGFDHLRRPPRT